MDGEQAHQGFPARPAVFRRAAQTTLCALVLALIAQWAVRVFLSLPMPPPYSGSGPYERGFFLQGIGNGLILLLFAALMFCAALPRVRWLRAVLILPAILAPAIMWGLLIPDFWMGFPPIEAVPWLLFAVAPSALYVLISRRPVWWLTVSLAYLAMWLYLSGMILY